MARKGLMAKVSNTVFLVGAAAVAVGGALLLAARKAKAKQKPTKKTAKPGGVAPADAPAPSPLPQPEPTSAPVAESMDRIGMSAAPAVFVAGIQGTTKCKVVMFGPLPSLAQFDPFSATSEDRTKITMDVVTTLSFLKKDGSFAGWLRTTTNLQLTETPKWEMLIFSGKNEQVYEFDLPEEVSEGEGSDDSDQATMLGTEGESEDRESNDPWNDALQQFLIGA